MTAPETARAYPTSQQYALGVAIGHLLVQAIQDGMTYDEIISTLNHSVRLIEDHRDLHTFGIKTDIQP